MVGRLAWRRGGACVCSGWGSGRGVLGDLPHACRPITAAVLVRLGVPECPPSGDLSGTFPEGSETWSQPWRHGVCPARLCHPLLHCWVVLMEPLLARNRGRSAHLQRGCVPPPRPVARGCCEEWLGGGLTGRSLSPPRALAPPAEAAAPPLTGCPPRPGGHTPSARGASWAGLGGPPPAPSALSGSPRRGSGWWAGRTSAGQTPRWPGWRRGDLPVRGPGGSAGLALTGRVLCPQYKRSQSRCRWRAAPAS